MKKKIWMVLLLAVCQVVILLGMAGIHYYTKWYGKEIVLQTEPIDPQDLFYGDYVYLNYTISNVPYSKWEGDEKPQFGEKVYVLLKSGKEGYEVIQVTKEKPKASGDEVVLKAKAMDVLENKLHLLYGLERYYVKEGEGKELEQRMGTLKVHVKISDFHQFISKTEIE
jgi:uncharacterized membrane-anchored protein